MNAAGAPPFVQADGRGFTNVVAQEVFRRAGLELQIVTLPAERALRLADGGQLDGELGRIGGLEAQYPNLVRVPEPITEVRFAAFARDAGIPADLPALRLRTVGLVRGWKYLEQAMAGAEHVVTASDPEQLFRLLALGRVEVALYESTMGTALAASLGLSGVRRLEPPLARREVFTYLNRKHAALAPALAAAIRSVKRDGFYARARRELLGRYLEPQR
jgi:polar amino acid transport system substrate-binding protein